MDSRQVPPLLNVPREETLIATGSPSPPSSVFIPFFFHGGEWTLLLEKRTGAISHPGQFAFPGGHYEGEDGSLLATALRETSEELGVPLNVLEPGGKVGIVVNPWGKVVHGFWGYLNAKTLKELHPSSMEVDSLYLLPVRHLLSSSSFRTSAMEWTASTGSGASPTPRARVEAEKSLRHEVISFHASFGVIWGITGRFLLMVRQLLPPEEERVKIP
jgi:8-oxo-dGTP pyrophosphatase MutT (NUDIX family)